MSTSTALQTPAPVDASPAASTSLRPPTATEQEANTEQIKDELNAAAKQAAPKVAEIERWVEAMGGYDGVLAATHLKSAEKDMEKNRMPSAVLNLRVAVRIAPDSPAGKTAQSLLGDPRLQGVEPSTEEAQQFAETWLKRGQVFAKSGQPDSARRDYQLILEFAPSSQTASQARTALDALPSR
jgi:hypothetical protein